MRLVFVSYRYIIVINVMPSGLDFNDLAFLKSSHLYAFI